jgi:hypothetical protein
MLNINRSHFQGHPFHLISPSPWPILTCISLFILTTSGVLCMHNFSHAGYLIIFLLSLVILLASGITITYFHHSLILVKFYRLSRNIAIEFKWCM